MTGGWFVGDLVCWDFGDTLVDEQFMRVAPADCPEWTDVYASVVDDHRAQIDAWDLGVGSVRGLVPLLAPHLNMSRPAISRHLIANLCRIEWFPEAKRVIDALDGQVLQAIVTVNPHEFWAMAVATGIDRLVDCIVTSADVASLSKVVMAEAARETLGLETGIATTLLIDNKQHNIDDFVSAGGNAQLYERDGFAGFAASAFGL